MDNDDILFGGAGADYLSGDSGNDVLYGGAGADEIWTGTGADILRYEDILDSPIGAGDVISDFVAGRDKLDFSGLADNGVGGMQDLTITQTGGTTIVSAAAAGFEVTLSGAIALTVADFIW
jgi:serralysin